MSNIKPLFPWMGGKRRLADAILEIMPAPHKDKSYIEPFAGGLAVLLARRPLGLEVVNDLDGEIVNFYRTLQKKGEELREYLQCMPYSRAEFTYQVKLSRDEINAMTDVQRAGRFFYIARSAFGGDIGTRSPSWGYPKAGGNSARAMMNVVDDRLLIVRDRLRNVHIENDSAIAVIKRFDCETAAFYCDPPYLAETRRRGEYSEEMTLEDHVQLLTLLKNVKGCVVVSGYPSELYSDMLADWQIVDFRVTCAINKNVDVGDEERARTERLWISPRLTELNNAKKKSKTNLSLFD